MIRLETARLVIRSYEEKDLPEYHKLMSDKQNMYYLDDIITETLEESRESLKNAIEISGGKARYFAVTLDDKLIGSCGYELEAGTPVGKVVSIGWFIMPEFQNKGYITEAVKKVLEFAFMRDNCVRVATGCYKDNIPTQKVMAKVGFRKEAERIQAQWHDGRMKDRLGFAINRDEYMRRLDEYNNNDDIYCDFRIKELLPEYKFKGAYEFLREDECAEAYAVAESCKGLGFTGESQQFLREWLTGEEISAENIGVTDCAVLIHKINAKTAGICCTGIYGHDSEKGAVVWIRMIAVTPECQGRGIGRNLLMQALQYGVEHGAKRAFLHVDLENKNAVKLYESVGFSRD